MKAGKKQKIRGVKHKIREERKREERIAIIVTVAILIAIIFVSGFLINSMVNQPSTNQAASSTTSSEPKAAIVDHLSLTAPNQTFIETATNTLKQAGYSVDYYPGEKVTVEFYRNLPTHGHKIIILRVHSTATSADMTERPVTLYTSEPYDRTKYVYEQLTDQLDRVAYSQDEIEKGIMYFGILPPFITQGMRGRFQNTIIIMMGCEGLNNTKMADAFIEKGAKVYISWDKSVLASHTDLATTHLLQHLITEQQTIKQAVDNANKQVGPDPAENSLLIYYPLEAGGYAIQNIVGNLVIGSLEIQHKALTEKRLRREASSLGCLNLSTLNHLQNLNVWNLS